MRMRRVAVVVALTLAWSAQAQEEGKKDSTDTTKIQGQWNLTYAECGGAEVTKKLLNWQSVSIDGKNIVMPNGGYYHPDPRDNFLCLAYKLNPKTDPKAIEIMDSGGVTKGCYLLDDDCLILRLSIDHSTNKPEGRVKTLLILQRRPT
jgi:uncharacterized protein (TIGR03067 family)